jgi:tetratricopeptide (TPR) repeat protein
MNASLVELVRLTDDPTYWNMLLRLERQDERDDHDLLMIYRIMSGTGSMDADTDYIEMAQLLGDSALPGEAAAVLQKASLLRIVRDEHRERVMRLLDALQARADSDLKGLPLQETESSASSVGELDVKLGQIYYGFEDYQSSVEAITRGLRKGLVAHKVDAYVYLGLAQLKLNNFAAARRAFASLKNVPDISPKTLRLWGLYADTSAGQTQAAERGGSRLPQLGNRD